MIIKASNFGIFARTGVFCRVYAQKFQITICIRRSNLRTIAGFCALKDRLNLNRDVENICADNLALGDQNHYKEYLRTYAGYTHVS